MPLAERRSGWGLSGRAIVHGPIIPGKARPAPLASSGVWSRAGICGILSSVRASLVALLLAGASLTCSGCFDIATVISVNGNGSGTIKIRTVVADTALEQIRQLGTLGGNAEPVDLFSEQQARAEAVRMGSGVTFVSSAPIRTATGTGSDVTYAFSDLSQLHLAQQPALPGSAGRSGAVAASAAQSVTLAIEQRPNGNAVVHIRTRIPELPFSGDASAAAGADSARGPSADQLTMVRQMLAGARVSVVIEPQGRLVLTTSPYADGDRVTLLYVDVDQLLTSETIDRIRAARSESDIRTLLKDAPGLKFSLEPETTIEFTPSR